MRRAWPAIAWGAALFGLSSIPGKDLTMVPNVPHLDKVAHLGLYTVFGFLVARALDGRDGERGQTVAEPRIAPFACERRGREAWAVALAAVATGVAYGASDEWHQGFVPGRSCSFWDWVSDCAGTVLGVAGWAAAETPQLRRRPAFESHAEPEV